MHPRCWTFEVAFLCCHIHATENKQLCADWSISLSKCWERLKKTGLSGIIFVTFCSEINQDRWCRRQERAERWLLPRRQSPLSPHHHCWQDAPMAILGGAPRSRSLIHLSCSVPCGGDLVPYVVADVPVVAVVTFVASPLPPSDYWCGGGAVWWSHPFLEGC